MGRNPFQIEKKKTPEDNFKTAIFYFMREFKINPLDPKNNINIPFFNTMMKELEEHYKKEAEAQKKANKGR